MIESTTMSSTYPSIKCFSELMRVSEDNQYKCDYLIRQYYQMRYETEYKKFIDDRYGLAKDK